MAINFEVSMFELLSHYELNGDLDLLKIKCSDELITEMAEKIQNWEKIAPSLGVNAEDVNDSTPNPSLRRIKCLREWKEHAGFKATYYALLKVLLKSGLQDTACNVCDVIIKSRCNYILFSFPSL